MVLDILCVYEDGSERDPGVPSPAARAVAIQLAQGTDATLRLLVVNAAGIPVDLTQTDWSVALALKSKPTDPSVVLSKTAAANPQDGDGRADVVISAADTIPLLLGRYFFDVVLTRGEDGPRDAVLPVSVLQLGATCA